MSLDSLDRLQKVNGTVLVLPAFCQTFFRRRLQPKKDRVEARGKYPVRKNLAGIVAYRLGELPAKPKSSKSPTIANAAAVARSPGAARFWIVEGMGPTYIAPSA